MKVIHYLLSFPSVPLIVFLLGFLAPLGFVEITPAFTHTAAQRCFIKSSRGIVLS